MVADDRDNREGAPQCRAQRVVPELRVIGVVEVAKYYQPRSALRGDEPQYVDGIGPAALVTQERDDVVGRSLGRRGEGSDAEPQGGEGERCQPRTANEPRGIPRPPRQRRVGSTRGANARAAGYSRRLRRDAAPPPLPPRLMAAPKRKPKLYQPPLLFTS